PMPEEILEILTKCASDEGKFYVGITDSLRQSIMQCVFNVAMKLVEPNIAQKENAWAYDDALKNILSDQTRSNLHERICGVWGEIEKDLFFNNIARDNTKSEILTNIAIHEFSKKIEKYCERLEIDIKTENGLTKYGNLLYELCHIFDVYKQGINRCLFDKKRVPNTLEKKEILKKRALMEGYHFEGITDSLRKDTFNIIYYLALDFLEPYFGLRKKAYTKNEYLKNVLFEENSSTSSLYIALQQEWKKVEKWLDLQKAKYETSIEQLKMRDKELTRSAILKLSQKVLKFCEEQKIDVEDETSEDEYYRILKGTFSIFSIYRNAIHKCLLTKKRMPNQEEKKEIQKKRHVFAETYFEGVPEFFGEYILDIVYDLALQILEPHIALEKDAYVSDKCLEKVLDDDYGFKIRERIWNAWKQIGNWVQSKRKDFAPSVFKKWKQELSETVYSFLEEAFDIIPLDYRYNAVSCQRLRKSFKNEFFEQKNFESINKEKIDTIVNYVDEVFGFLVKGKKCKVSKVNYVSHTSAKWSKKLLKRISTTEGGIYSKDIDKNLTKQQEGLLLKVVSPLAQEEKEIFLEINPKTYFRNPPEKIYRGIRLCLMPFVEKEQDREKYFINVAFSGTRNNREIYVETDKDSFSLTNYSTKEEVRDFLGSVVCEVTRTAPSFVKDTIFENIPDFSKLDEKSALIFSQKVTFDNGVGALLPKLARADIKLGVVAKTEKQKTIIRYINEIELADEKNKIFFAETVAEVVSEIKKDTPRFYYFKIDEDAEETLPRNVILVDKLTVERIIAAIGKACGFVDEKMMPLYEAAQKFAQAV
ncbi:MAG: hypothetical protein KJ864_07075, partial [Candidatus Omnitrophica bacterium]|nr:hypothetical protein [Candidatus Omnitrophota bacterium]